MYRHKFKHYHNKSIQLRDLPRILEKEIPVKSLQIANKTLRQTQIVSHKENAREDSRRWDSRDQFRP